MSPEVRRPNTSFRIVVAGAVLRCGADLFERDGVAVRLALHGWAGSPLAAGTVIQTPDRTLRVLRCELARIADHHRLDVEVEEV